MKIAIAALAAAAAVTSFAGAAGAQPLARDASWGAINARQAQIEQRIDRGAARGDLTRREAARLQAESRQIARLEARYRIGGLSQPERADLARRLDRLEAQVAFERHDRQARRG